MRNIWRWGIFGSVFLFLVVFTCPMKVHALVKETDYIDIHSSATLEIGELSFLNISYQSSLETEEFGVTSVLTNQAKKSIPYTSTVYYYDQNYSYLGSSSENQTAQLDDQLVRQMSYSTVLIQHSIPEIRYFRFAVATNEDAQPNTSKEEFDWAESIKKGTYQSLTYYIQDCDIQVVVNENKTIDVQETITAYFNQPMESIFINIPIQNKRVDGSIADKRTKIFNLKINHKFKMRQEKEYYRIQIDSPYRSFTGEETFIIQYTYTGGKDSVVGSDELYYHLLEEERNTVIDHVTFTIVMPKQFDSKQLDVFISKRGTLTKEDVPYTVTENTISGKIQTMFGKIGGLVIVGNLPDGYFVGANSTLDMWTLILLCVPIICLIISIFLWNRFGRSREGAVVKTIEFYPPDACNSVEVAFLYKGFVTWKDVTSLLIYLANQGYIQIVDHKINPNKVSLDAASSMRAKQKIATLEQKIEDERAIDPNSKKLKYYYNLLDIYQNIDKPIDYNLYGAQDALRERNYIADDYTIRKLKDYDGENVELKLFMRGLFVNGRTEVTEDMLYQKFYRTVRQIATRMNREENKNKIFCNTKRVSFMILVMILLSFFSIIGTTFLPYLTFDFVFAIVVGQLLISFILYASAPDKIAEKRFLVKLNILIWVVILGYIAYSHFPFDIFYIILYGAMGICLFGMLLCFQKMFKRTAYGNEMLGKILGFKDFLESAEKEKLEAMVMQDPKYFYHILPYTYVLGISDTWIKKFETIAFDEPDWYDHTSSFDSKEFGAFIDSTMKSAQDVMTSEPVSSSSSFSDNHSSSSGGGSAGAGSGGGGGGAW